MKHVQEKNNAKTIGMGSRLVGEEKRNLRENDATQMRKSELKGQRNKRNKTNEWLI